MSDTDADETEQPQKYRLARDMEVRPEGVELPEGTEVTEVDTEWDTGADVIKVETEDGGAFLAHDLDIEPVEDDD